jgi:hypothetical protein
MYGSFKKNGLEMAWSEPRLLHGMFAVCTCGNAPRPFLMMVSKFGFISGARKSNAAVNVNPDCQESTRIRRRIDGESWAKYFFTVDFLANPLKLCVVNSSNSIWVLIVLIFVEFLSSYLLSACRIQNVRSAPQNARTTSHSIHCTRWKRWAWFDISPVFTDFSPSK